MTLSQLNEDFINKKKLILQPKNSNQSERIVLLFDKETYKYQNKLLGSGGCCYKPKFKEEHKINTKFIPYHNECEYNYDQDFQTQKIQKYLGQDDPTDDGEVEEEISVVVSILKKSFLYDLMEVFDLQTDKIILRKRYNKTDLNAEQQEYNDLKSFYSIQKKYIFNNVPLFPAQATQNSINFNVGPASLQELALDHKFCLNQQQFIHIFTRLLDFILFLREIKYCISDHKSQIITLTHVKEDKYEARFVLLGEYKQQSITLLTKDNNTIKKEEINNLGFKQQSQSQNLGKQYYRIIKIIMLLEYQQLQHTSTDVDRRKLLIKKSINRFQQILNNLINSDSCKGTEILLILRFLNQQHQLEHNFFSNDIYCLLQNMKQMPNFDKNYLYFIESNQEISNILIAKRQEARSKIVSIQQLQCYIRPQGSTNQKYQNRINLTTYLQEYLLESSNMTKNVVIFGQSGQGKTLFLKNFQMLLRQDQQKFQHFDIIFITFRDLSRQCGLLFSQLVLCIKSQLSIVNKQDQKRAIILFLDGFDELNNKQIKINSKLQKIFKNRVTIVVSSRLQYVNNNHFQECFGVKKHLYLCPLDDIQKINLITKDINLVKKLKNKICDLQNLQAVLDNIEQFQQQIVLQKISAIPLNLQIMLLAIQNHPQINNNNIDIQNMTKFTLFQTFIKQYMINQLKKALEIDNELKKLILEHLKMDQSIAFMMDNQITDQFVSELYFFHQICSWNMLQKKQIQLNSTELSEAFLNRGKLFFQKFSNHFKFLIQTAPVQSYQKPILSYLHQSVQEFFIVQSVIQETLEAKLQPININTTKLGQTFLIYELEILQEIADHVSSLNLENQYLWYYETWYKSVLLTRSIKQKDLAIDEKKKFQLKVIGSNCMNILLSQPHCDLTYRDFSDCAIPNADFQKRDLTGNGNYLASGCKDGTLKLWTVELKKELATLRGHTQKVNFIAFSPDGKYLASCSYDGTVKLWNIQKLKVLNTFRYDTWITIQVVFSPDGKYLASLYWNRKIKIWNLESQRLMENIAQYRSNISWMAFCNQNSYLASQIGQRFYNIWSFDKKYYLISPQHNNGQFAVSPDGKYFAYQDDLLLYILNLQTNQSLKIHNSYNRLTSIIFSPDSKYLLFGSQNQTVKLWDVELQKDIAQLQYYSEGAAFSPDSSKYFAFGSCDNSIQLWRTDSLSDTSAHGREVNSVTFSPDCRYFASGSSDKTIQVWSVQTQTRLMNLIGHFGYVASVAFSIDSQFFASGSADRSIKIWSMSSQREVNTLMQHTGVVSSIAYSSNGKFLASGSHDATLLCYGVFSPSSSQDNTVKLWSVESKKSLATLKKHVNYVASVAYSPDGNYLASGSGDFTAMLWSVKQQKWICTLRGHTSAVYSVAFSANSQYLASGGQDNNIILWSIQKQQIILNLEGHKDIVLSLAFSSDRKYLISGSRDNSIKLWKIQNKNQLKKPLQYDFISNSIAFSPDSKSLAFVGTDSTLKLWSVESQQQQQLKQNFRHTAQNLSVAFSLDGIYLASGSQGNTVILQRLHDDQEQQEVKVLLGHSDCVHAVAFSPNCIYLASGSADKTIKLWNVQSKKEESTLKYHLAAILTVSFSADDQYLASGSVDQTIVVWLVSSKQHFLTLREHDDSVYCVVISPDNKYLASSSFDKQIKLFTVKNWREEIKFQQNSGIVKAIAFSPDSQFIATGNDHNQIELLEIKSQKISKILNGHTEQIVSVAFSPDGKYLASSSLDETIKIWKLQLNRDRLILDYNLKNYFVAFSSDGKYLATKSQANVVKIWDADKQSEIRTLQEISSQIWQIAFTIDGQYLVCRNETNIFRIWSIRNQKEVQDIDSQILNNLKYSKISPLFLRHYSKTKELDNLVSEEPLNLKAITFQMHQPQLCQKNVVANYCKFATREEAISIYNYFDKTDTDMIFYC